MIWVFLIAVAIVISAMLGSFVYLKDGLVVTLPSKSAVARYWNSQEGTARWPSNRAAMDVGEPACFACDYFAET